MEAFDVVGLLPTLIEVVRDRVVGYDEQIMKRFDHAIAKALKPTAKHDDSYIRNAMCNVSELIDKLVQAFDNPARIKDIKLPYINEEEFRRLYNQIQKDKELVIVLKDEWNHFISKDTNNRVKAIQAEIDKLTNEIKKVGEGVGEVKGDTGEIKKGLGELKEVVNEGFNKINERFDDKYDKKGGNRNEVVMSLCDYLKEKLENKRKHHPSFRLMDIDDDLFPDGMVTFDTEARDSNNELKTVRKIVAESWEKGETNHLMIEGEGGIGKTVTLLSLPDKFAPHPVPAIYIPLHELKGETNTIEKYIKGQILDSKEQYDLLLKVINKPWSEGPNLLLLLDGFNEILIDLREAISEDIEHWSELPGLQIITSSRYDIHQYVALRSSFSKIELQPLSEETVSDYLENNKIGIPENKTVTKLITIPLLLTLYIKAEAIRNDRPSKFAKFLETKNAGLLIWNYMQCELWRFKNKKEEAKSCVLSMEFIAPYIAWTMQQHSEFVLDESSFLDRIEEAYNLMKKHIDAPGHFPEHIKTTMQQSPGLPNIEYICDLLKEQLCLFINNEGEYRLMHQQFRDALAAMHLINSSYLSGGSLPEEWESTIDYYVMQFVVDLISEDEAMRLWEQNRKTIPTIENATRDQLRLQGILHDNDYSHLDFSGLDLSDISLYSYRFNLTTIKLPSQCERMNKTKLSNKTFTPGGHTGWVYAVTVTPDGKRIVSGSVDCTIRIWDLETCEAMGKPIRGHQDVVRTVAVTPDGKRIISGSGDSIICVWDLKTGEPMGMPIGGHEYDVNAVVVTPDGKCIVSGSSDKTIRVWDLETGKQIGKTIEGLESTVNAVVVTPDGKRIVSGSGKIICVWDLETGELIGKPIEGHKVFVNSIIVTPDGKRIVSGSADSSIRIWDLDTGEPIGKPIEGYVRFVHAVTVTLDGKRIISGSDDGTVRVWDLETGEPIGRPIEGHVGRVNAVAVTPDGKRIVSGSDDRTIRVWDLETGEPMGKPIEGYKNGVGAIAVTPDGKHFISGAEDSTIRVWDLETVKQIGRPIEGHVDSIYAIAVTPDGKRIVSGSKDNTIRVWDIETGESMGKPIEGHKGWVNAVAVTPDGKRIISGSADRTIRVWDLETGEPMGKPIGGYDGWDHAVAVTPDGKHVISGSDDRTIRVWDLETGELAGKTIGRHSYVRAIAVTPDGKRIVGGSWDNNIHMWDLETGEPMGKPIEGHKSWVNTVVVTPDGKHIVSGSHDRTICVWNLETGELTGKLVEGHKGLVEAVAVTPDSKRIISGSEDGTICITDIETREVKTIHNLPLSFVGLDFSKAIISSPELKEILRQNGAKV